MLIERQITAEEAQLWLAGLEKVCLICSGQGGLGGLQWDGSLDVNKCLTCNGTGKVPVLDLREPCPCLSLPENPPDGINHAYDRDICKQCYLRYSRTATFHVGCFTCSGRNWVPKQGEAALHQAMNKTGWDLTVDLFVSGARRVWFRRIDYVLSYLRDGRIIGGEDSNDFIAAYKAMMRAGYCGPAD